jgi:His/Glu/Gln/Arg/opine family amino acid ABC transporter permease subunit
LLRAAVITLELTALALLFGVPLGLVLALARLSGVLPLRLVATWYVELVRGTPLLIQIFVIFYVVFTPDLDCRCPPFGRAWSHCR